MNDVDVHLTAIPKFEGLCNFHGGNIFITNLEYFLSLIQNQKQIGINLIVEVVCWILAWAVLQHGLEGQMEQKVCV